MKLLSCTLLQDQRNQMGLSQQGLATAAGVSMSTIAKLEAVNQDGKKGPRLDTARAIAAVLGCHVDDVFPVEPE